MTTAFGCHEGWGEVNNEQMSCSRDREIESHSFTVMACSRKSTWSCKPGLGGESTQPHKLSHKHQDRHTHTHTPTFWLWLMEGWGELVSKLFPLSLCPARILKLTRGLTFSTKVLQWKIFSLFFRLFIRLFSQRRLVILQLTVKAQVSRHWFVDCISFGVAELIQSCALWSLSSILLVTADSWWTRQPSKDQHSSWSLSL